MSIRALSIAEVAKRTGVELEALRTLVRRGQFPDPDVIIGGDSRRPVRGWTAETVDAWAQSRSDKRPS